MLHLLLFRKISTKHINQIFEVLLLTIIRFQVNKVTITLLNLIIGLMLQHVNEENLLVKVLNFLLHLIIDFQLN